MAWRSLERPFFGGTGKLGLDTEGRIFQGAQEPGGTSEKNTGQENSKTTRREMALRQWHPETWMELTSLITPPSVPGI